MDNEIITQLRSPASPKKHEELCQEAAHMIEALETKIAELEQLARRYHVVRQLNIVQFSDIWTNSFETGRNFDDLIDAIGK